MKKLYAFLMVFVALGVISSEVARADTYAMTDYTILTTTGSGSSWSEITGGTTITGQYGLVYYYQLSNAYQIPFNFRFLNQQITTTTTFTVNAYGTVICSPTWAAGTNNYPYDWEALWYYFNEYYYGTTYLSNYPYDLGYSEGDYGSYGYYADFRLAPFEGFETYGNGSGVGADYRFVVLGSAPSRQLIVQAKGVYAYYYGSSQGLRGSWQTVINEQGISNFQFNYGPQTGTFNTSWGYNYYYYSSSNFYYTQFYGGYTAIKANGANNFLSVGWNGNGWDATRAPQVAYGLSNGGMPIRNDTAARLPQVSYHILIAHQYDFTAGMITIPADQQPQKINSGFYPTATITNAGYGRPTSLQVSFTITQLNVARVYTSTRTLTGAQVPAPFTTSTIVFDSFTVPAFGIYDDTMIVYNLQPTADQNAADNTSTNEWICSPDNDIKTVSVLNPPNGSNARTPIAVATPVQMRFRNLGLLSQTNVPVTAVITDPSGTVVYRDTVIIPNWPSGPTGGNSDASQSYAASGQGPGKGAYYDTTFKDWIPASVGFFKVCGIAILANDQLRGDDTICAITEVRPPYDAAAVAVVNPQPDEEKPYTLSWQPAALFQSVGVSNLFDVPVRVQIKRCTDGALVFQADSSMPELNIDQNQVRFQFPSDQGPYHISQLLPGCYTICAIARYPSDGDHTNDTVCSQFTIIDRLKGDIYVGVGQRFQTIHAAVDSMRFRGIGGNLRLILRDAAYTENGTYRVSSQLGALDFRGIRGLSATSTVSWIPYPGVTPTVTFTGNKISCLYFGDLFGGFMTFEGYNPRGVPIPDKLTNEPNKRGITIVDNRTVAGSIFDIEQGASRITLKDLVLRGNGNFANDSSSVVRIYNDQNRTLFLQQVLDTVPINHIVVNNCELGNSKYGIRDHGLHDQFNLGQSKFIVWRNNSNVFTRNTIGTPTSMLSYAGIQFNNEQDLTISHNEVSNIDVTLAGVTGNSWNAFGIEQPNVTQSSPIWPGDTGNVVRVWVDANRIHNVRAFNGSAYGIAFQQANTIYFVGNPGPTQPKSQPPAPTQNRVTNNMVFDLRTKAVTGSYPILMNTAGAVYTTDLDSVFNNSISTNNATANITVQLANHVFLWNNIFQNTGAGPYTNYVLQVPRPFASSISSDYNLFDLRGNNTFATVNEYDVRYGTALQTRTFRRINDWRTYVGQDQHSLTGDPMFASPAMGTDSLHMPPALTYVESPASNNGAWLGTATQARDFDGDLRLQGNQTPDIGADEFDGFQYTNDLFVSVINQPSGFSQTSDTSLVTTENPLWINATVKNLSSQAVFNRSVTATVEVAIAPGTWQTIYSSTTAPMTWDVNESKNVVFQGPTLTANQIANGVFRVTVTVPNDQNNVNNSQQKVFRVLLKSNAVLVSYNGAHTTETAPYPGTQNRDSVTRALGRLGIPYDLIDRNAPNGLAATTDIDYRPWWTLIWVSGDPSVAPVSGQPTAQAGLSFKETQELERYLRQGLSYAKKNLVVAGQNIAFYDGFVMSNNTVTDSEWLQSYMHTMYVANSPISGTYNGTIIGQQPAYWKSPDNINSASPDVIKPSFKTPLVGPEVTGFAYTYKTHPLTPNDSGAGTSYYNNLINTVFYGFDWSDPYQTSPSSSSQDNLTSGTTRILAAAFAFFTSHAGTILAVDFVSAKAQHEGASALISWEVAGQKDVARYDVEQQQNNAWMNIGHADAIENSTRYAYTDASIDLTQTYTYRIAAVDKSGAKTYSNTIELGPDASQLGYTLSQSYPNPSAGITEISFTLPVASQVTLRVLDVTGKAVWSMTNAPYAAGEQSIKLDLGSLASGSYVYELIATGPDGQSVTLSKKLTLAKQ